MPVAERFCSSHVVTVIKRSLPTVKDHTLNLPVKLADIRDQDSLLNALPDKIDYVLVCISPYQYSKEAYHLTFVVGIENLIQVLRRKNIIPKRVFFVSSTSIYHQSNGEEVDEQSVVKPASFASQCLKVAENRLLDSRLPATCVRFSGIYGGRRTRLIERVTSGRAQLSAANHLTNRIHESDCIGVLCHLLQLAMKGASLDSMYLATDNLPVPINTVLKWLAAQLGKPLLTGDEKADRQKTTNQATREQQDKELTTGKQPKRKVGSKRCSNRKLLATGYTFAYPTYKEGYSMMLKRIRVP